MHHSKPSVRDTIKPTLTVPFHSAYLVQVKLPEQSCGEGEKRDIKKSVERVLFEELCLQELSEGRKGGLCSNRALEI